MEFPLCYQAANKLVETEEHAITVSAGLWSAERTVQLSAQNRLFSNADNTMACLLCRKLPPLAKCRCIKAFFLTQMKGADYWNVGSELQRLSLTINLIYSWTGK